MANINSNAAYARKDIVSADLLRRFIIESLCDGGDGRHYAVIEATISGNLLVHAPPDSPALSPAQLVWAAGALCLLNRAIHRDGAWVIVFTHPNPLPPGADIAHAEYGRYVILWLDADGDVQFAVEWRENESELLTFADVIDAGLDSIAEKCDAAWQLWHLLMRDVLAPGEGQLYRRARGETPPSTVH